MARKNGQILTCDRCSESIFLKCTGEGEMDGGYNRWNKFEAPPEGWDRIINVGDVCPKCNAEYKTILDKFKNELHEAGFKHE